MIRELFARGFEREAGAFGVPAGPIETRALFEKQFLRRKLAECHGNVSLLAEKIGLERSNLYRKLKDHNLESLP